MNEITVAKNKIIGVDGFSDKVAEAAKSIGLMKATPENSALCAKCVTEHNATLEGFKAVIDEARKQYNAPFDAAVSKAVGAVAAYESLAKTEQAEVLAAKKQKAKDEAYGVFVDLAKLSKDGSVPDWDSFYDPSWYSLNSALLRSYMAAKLAEFSKNEEPNDPKAVSIFTVRGSKDVAKVAQFMHDNGISFEKEDL